MVVGTSLKVLPKRAFVSTVPFGVINAKPLELLDRAGVEVVINPLGRKLKEAEVADFLKDFPVVIAGTEQISAKTLENCPNLKAICRVGIGLDSVDLPAARRLGIAVSYTPDGPSPAVAELAVGLMIDLLRGAHSADRGLRRGDWTRHTGRRLGASTIGIVGVGRIGKCVIHHLNNGFPGVRILAHDLTPDPSIPNVQWTDAQTIYSLADIVSLHVPLTAQTVDMITSRELALFKPGSLLVNTARGGIVNEADLAQALRTQRIAGAAVDVFMEEPYCGELTEIETALLTCHMGSMTVDCRARMEIEAAEDAIAFLQGKPFRNPVPDDEYANAERMARR